MPRVDLNSTLLSAADYQDQRALLELEFRSGAVYHYFDVPPRTYQELLLADSHGAYFNHHIRKHFVHAKIRAARSPFILADSDPTGTSSVTF